jgi:hypothetical protein
MRLPAQISACSGVLFVHRLLEAELLVHKLADISKIQHSLQRGVEVVHRLILLFQVDGRLWKKKGLCWCLRSAIL